nr:hypothetical protein [Pandoravirus belohorizontensis]
MRAQTAASAQKEKKRQREKGEARRRRRCDFFLRVGSAVAAALGGGKKATCVGLAGALALCFFFRRCGARFPSRRFARVLYVCLRSVRARRRDDNNNKGRTWGLKKAHRPPCAPERSAKKKSPPAGRYAETEGNQAGAICCRFFSITHWLVFFSVFFWSIFLLPRRCAVSVRESGDWTSHTHTYNNEKKKDGAKQKRALCGHGPASGRHAPTRAARRGLRAPNMSSDSLFFCTPMPRAMLTVAAAAGAAVGWGSCV